MIFDFKSYPKNKLLDVQSFRIYNKSNKAIKGNTGFGNLRMKALFACQKGFFYGKYRKVVVRWTLILIVITGFLQG